MKVVIMAGGRGTRFWPRSVEHKPKQFLAIVSHQTMLQQTYDRFREWLPLHCIYVLAPKAYLDLVKEQLPDVTESQIIIEPHQKDTGPCIGLTACHFLNEGDDDVIVTVASDHLIPDSQALIQVLRKAEQVVHATGSAVTIGIIPTRPDSGYGYIQAGGMLDANDEVFKVQQFIEKPPLEKARELVQSDRVYWNSGIVVWRPSIIQKYMERHQQVMWTALNERENLDQKYAMLPKISVDYAILEKVDDLYCIPADFEWHDVGSWKSIERIRTQDAEGNTIMGEIHVLMSKNNLIYTEQPKAVIIGVHDLIVVSTPDGLLVCHKSQEDQIKPMLERLRDE